MSIFTFLAAQKNSLDQSDLWRRFKLLKKCGELLRCVAGFDGGDGFVGEFVAAFVVGVAGMAFDPVPVDFVVGSCSVEFAPEVGVFDGLLCAGAPTVAFPTGDPLADALADVLRVSVKIDIAGLFEDAQGFNGGLQLHAVIRRGGDAAFKLTNVFAVSQHHGPAPGAGITVAAAVGMNDDFLHAGV